MLEIIIVDSWCKILEQFPSLSVDHTWLGKRVFGWFNEIDDVLVFINTILTLMNELLEQNGELLRVHTWFEVGLDTRIKLMIYDLVQ